MKVQRRISYVMLYIILLVAVLLYQRSLVYREIHTIETIAVNANSLVVEDISLEQFQVLYQRALAYSASYNYEEAAENFYLAYRITQRHPSLLFAFPDFLENFHQALLNRSLIYLHQGNEELAIQDYDLAMTLLPDLYSSSKGCWLVRRLHCDEQSSRRITNAITTPILVPQ